MKTLMLTFMIAVIAGCGDRVPDPVDINMIGTWTMGGAYDPSVGGTVKEVWTFGATTLQIDRTDFSGNPIDSTSYSWEKIEPGHIVLNGSIDVMIEEIASTCFVLNSMPGRSYVYRPNFLRPEVQ